MNCLEPIHLKNGLWVPCGKCLLCESQKRVERSVCVQMHIEAYGKMPLFIGLSYAPEYLPYRHVVSGRYWRAAEVASVIDDEERQRFVPSVYRADVSAFLKAYKRVHNLKVSDFTYFGCGEYGGKYQRPHYHLIWFGDELLENLFEKDVHKAERWLAEFWHYGNVDICPAEYGGIHYTTKYCLKEEQTVPDGAHPCFTIMGHGIGWNWLKTAHAEKIRQQYLYLQYNKDRIFDDLGSIDVPLDADIYTRLDLLKQQRDYLRPLMPDFRVRLPSGQRALLPRKLRRKVIGSFNVLKENPFLIYQDIEQSIESYEYLLNNPDSDKDQYTEHMEQLTGYAIKIQQRINRNKSKFK